jgi:hypothetical protein
MSVTEYMIVEESGTYAAEEVRDRVNRLLAEGWQPLGGVAVAGDGERGGRLLQAMIRSNGLREP